MKVKSFKIKWVRLVAVILIVILLLNTANIARLFYPVRYMNHIKQYASEYNVDPYLVMSIIKTESNFDETAVSKKNASGLMQIIEPTALWLAERMGLSDFTYDRITEPELNIQMGCYYISYLLTLYDGNEKNALAAYNAGDGTVDRWLANSDYSKDGITLSNVPYPETRKYITKVMNHRRIYRLLYRLRSATALSASLPEGGSV